MFLYPPNPTFPLVSGYAPCFRLHFGHGLGSFSKLLKIWCVCVWSYPSPQPPPPSPKPLCYLFRPGRWVQHGHQIWLKACYQLHRNLSPPSPYRSMNSLSSLHNVSKPLPHPFKVIFHVVQVKVFCRLLLANQTWESVCFGGGHVSQLGIKEGTRCPRLVSNGCLLGNSFDPESYLQNNLSAVTDSCICGSVSWRLPYGHLKASLLIRVWLWIATQ